MYSPLFRQKALCIVNQSNEWLREGSDPETQKARLQKISRAAEENCRWTPEDETHRTVRKDEGNDRTPQQKTEQTWKSKRLNLTAWTLLASNEQQLVFRLQDTKHCRLQSFHQEE